MNDNEKLIAAIDAATAAIDRAVAELKALSDATGRANYLQQQANGGPTWFSLERRKGGAK